MPLPAAPASPNPFQPQTRVLAAIELRDRYTAFQVNADAPFSAPVTKSRIAFIAAHGVCRPID
jgi:hypothetical protein